MSLTVSELQSIVKRNSNHIRNLEKDRKDRKDFICETKSRFKVPDSMYTALRKKTKELKVDALHQRLLKQELKSLYQLVPKSSEVPKIEAPKYSVFYVEVFGEEHSNLVQQIMFNLGYRWASGSVNPLSEFSHCYLQTFEDGTIKAQFHKEFLVGVCKILTTDGQLTTFPDSVEIYEPPEVDHPVAVNKVEVPNVVGDIHSDAMGSGARYNNGKPDYSLIPLCTMDGEARVWMKGTEKYTAWNWMRGMKWSVPLASALRHLSKWQSGEDIDEESGESHLDHIMCNIRMLKLYTKTFTEGDDRPKKWLHYA